MATVFDGAEVRRRRVALGWSELELRLYSGVVDINGIEEGRVVMDEDDQHRILDAFDVHGEEETDV